MPFAALCFGRFKSVMKFTAIGKGICAGGIPVLRLNPKINISRLVLDRIWFLDLPGMQGEFFWER
jgi:hypothetical protein